MLCRHVAVGSVLCAAGRGIGIVPADKRVACARRRGQPAQLTAVRYGDVGRVYRSPAAVGVKAHLVAVGLPLGVECLTSVAALRDGGMRVAGKTAVVVPAFKRVACSRRRQQRRRLLYGVRWRVVGVVVAAVQRVGDGVGYWRPARVQRGVAHAALRSLGHRDAGCVVPPVKRIVRAGGRFQVGVGELHRVGFGVVGVVCRPVRQDVGNGVGDDCPLGVKLLVARAPLRDDGMRAAGKAAVVVPALKRVAFARGGMQRDVCRFYRVAGGGVAVATAV